MTLNGKQLTVFMLAGLFILTSVLHLDVTVAAVHFWWRVGHPGQSDFIMHKWWTPYTVASALFAPVWLMLVCSTVLLSRRHPLLAVSILCSFFIVMPLSCVSAGDNLFGLEELPFAGAERNANWEHLTRMVSRLKLFAHDAGTFPTSAKDLIAAVGNVAFESSPYVHSGKRLTFDLGFVLNGGTAYATKPEKPAIVYYAVSPNGKQFVLTISGLNKPISSRASMMKADAFAGEKQPWQGMLAKEESLYGR